MKQIRVVLWVLISLINPSYAKLSEPINPWTLEAAFGMARYPDMMNNDGQTPMARLSLGRVLILHPAGELTLEAGIQSGNTMRLTLPKESIDVLGGLPIEAKMKPLLDVLLGLKTEPFNTFPMVIWLKGGVAYRNLQLDRTSVADVNGVAPEIQLGFGYRINGRTTINMSYQSIWGKKPELTVNELNETGFLRNIPSQEAIMMGLTFNF